MTDISLGDPAKDSSSDDEDGEEKFIWVRQNGTQTETNVPGDSTSDAAKEEATKKAKEEATKKAKKKALIIGGSFAGATAALGGIAFIALNVAVPAVGFTSLGITAGSWAASLMSSAAIANGGGVAAGSAVAILQSVGATGVAATTCLAGGAGVAAAGTGAAIGIDQIRGALRHERDAGPFPAETSPEERRVLMPRRPQKNKQTDTSD